MAAKEEFEVRYIQRMTEQTLDITTIEGKQDFVRNLVAYNVILEGIWFYSGFMVALSFRQRNLLRNFALADRLGRPRREPAPQVRHQPDPHRARGEPRGRRPTEFADEIRGMILHAVEMEEAYNRDLLPHGILGLNADYINTYVRYLADRRLEELGFEPAYNVANPAKWMATANDTLQLVNFFESINTSYEVDARA